MLFLEKIIFFFWKIYLKKIFLENSKKVKFMSTMRKYLFYDYYNGTSIMSKMVKFQPVLQH